MDNEAILDSVISMSKHFLSFADSMALKCAVELRVADIIHSHGHPITANEIASAMDSPTPNTSYLKRIMRMLVRMKIFTSTTQSDSGDVLYGLTPSSMALLHDAEISLASMLLMQNHPLLLTTWHYLSNCVKNSGSGFKQAHGCELFEMASKDPDLNKIFNDALQSSAMICAKAMVSAYQPGFKDIESIVDVGGGTGMLLAQIVKAFPHIKGIVFDLPHVVASATPQTGISHVAGDMFEGLPPADTLLISRTLHNWGDEDCVKILKNCRKAIAKKTGKVMIVDLVLRADAEQGDDVRGNLDLVLDLVMMAHCHGGRERTEPEWKKILEEAGFVRYKIIDLPFFASIIEAYPD